MICIEKGEVAIHACWKSAAENVSSSFVSIRKTERADYFDSILTVSLNQP